MQVTLSTLRTLNGAALKVFIILSNNSQPLSASQLAEQLSLTPRAIYKALDELNKRSLLVNNGSLFCTKVHYCEQKFNEKERSKEKENIDKIIISSAAATRAPEQNFENIIFSWLTDNRDYLTALAMRNHIAYTDEENGLIDAFRPYIAEFTALLRLRVTDIYQKGREDTKNHFISWLPKYLLVAPKHSAPAAPAHAAPAVTPSATPVHAAPAVTPSATPAPAAPAVPPSATPAPPAEQQPAVDWDKLVEISEEWERKREQERRRREAERAKEQAELAAIREGYERDRLAFEAKIAASKRK